MTLRPACLYAEEHAGHVSMTAGVMGRVVELDDHPA
jgi:hypothetical protein